MRVVRQGACIGQPSRCRGGTCSCCPECGDHRWSYGGAKCLSLTCSPMPSARIRAERADAKRKAEIAARKAEKAAALPDWLRTKPRSERQVKEALAYCKARGIPTNPPPWENQ